MNMVFLSGQVSWSTAPTGTGGVGVTGLPFPCVTETGMGFSGLNVENQAGAANGIVCELRSGQSIIYLYGYNENGLQVATDSNDLNSNGHINVNMMYMK